MEDGIRRSNTETPLATSPSTKNSDRRASLGGVVDHSPSHRRVSDSAMSGNSPRHPPGHGNRDGGFRIHLPSTRASSRTKRCHMTDSLKLYEEQIRNYNPPDGRRPLSLCIDFGSSGEETCVTDDSHRSSSSSSTVSSSSSSNSYSSNLNISSTGPDLPREELIKRDIRDSPVLAKNGRSHSNKRVPYFSDWDANPPNHESKEEFGPSSPGVTPSPSTSLARSISSASSAASSAVTVIPGPGQRAVSDSTGPGSSSSSELTDVSDLGSGHSSDFDTGGSKDGLCAGAEAPCLAGWSNLGGEGWEWSDEGSGEMTNYDLSTLDSISLGWLRMEVKEVRQSPTPERMEVLSPGLLCRWADTFNINRQGLRMKVEDDGTLTGSIRIFINLIKPIKMSLKQAALPLPDGETIDDSSPLRKPGGLTSFFLPRGTSKTLFITGTTTTEEVIEALLKKFHIQETPRKFALYEHTLENETTVLVRKYETSEYPLISLIMWAKADPEEFAETLRKKRIVLQENESSGEINWMEFSVPELQNFLKILEREEREYKEAISMHYSMLRDELSRQVTQSTLMKNTRTS